MSFIKGTEHDMTKFMKETGGELSDAFKYSTDFKQRLKDVKHLGKGVQRYTAQTIKHPLKPVDDVRNLTSGILKDSISDDHHTLLIFAGILYFIISNKYFRDLTNKFIKHIPLVEHFPHAVNTAIFLGLLYLVYLSKFSGDIEEKIDQLSDLIHT
tara:strand:+ start:421 stop:885 length:465 start_codon:yes stop_codon:yes gene_type:complete